MGELGRVSRRGWRVKRILNKLHVLDMKQTKGKGLLGEDQHSHERGNGQQRDLVEVGSAWV